VLIYEPNTYTMKILHSFLTYADIDDLKKVIEKLSERLPDLDEILQPIWKNISIRRFNDKRARIQESVDKLLISLPNGQKSKAYSADIKFRTCISEYQVESVSVDGLDELGLEGIYMAESGVLHVQGIPTKAETRELHVSVRVNTEVEIAEERRIFTKKVKITIVPDPRELWQDLPVSPDIAYYKESVAAAFIPCSSCQEKSVVAASVRGRSHAHTGKPRDDHFSVKYLEKSGWFLMMVADGAGSAVYSRRGSELACCVTMQECENWLDRESSNLEECVRIYQSSKLKTDEKPLRNKLYYLMGGASHAAYKAIVEEAKKTTPSRNIRDYATTLLATLAKKIDGYWFVCSFWIGDGAICLYQAAGTCGENEEECEAKIEIMGEPDSGESAGQTRFLTMPEILQDSSQIYHRIRFACVDDFSALFLMTDGVSDPKFDTENLLKTPALWEKLWGDLNTQIPELGTPGHDPSKQLLDWLMFWSEGNHDDRTIAILY